MNEKHMCLKRLLLTAALVSGCFHILLGLMQYYIDVSALRYVDYVLGGAVAVIAILYFAQNREALHRPSLEQGLLIALLIWYALSCFVMTARFEGNWIIANIEPYFDVCISVLLLFTLGRFFARRGVGQLPKRLLHAALIIWTILMVLVLVSILNNRIIDTPSGGQIGMNADIALALNCNQNTTGAIEIVFTLLCCCMVIWCRHPLLKILYVLASLVNFIILALSNSRTALIATAIAFALLVGLAVFSRVHLRQTWQRLLLAFAVAIAAFAAFLALRRLVFYLHESITHLRALLGQMSTGAGADAGGARSLTDATARTFSNRTLLWSAALQAMVYDLQRFIFGVTPVSVISMMRTISNGALELYTHNQFLEIGVALGAPGLCIFVAWTALILRDAFRMLFVRKEGLRSLIVIAVVAALAIGNLTEATLLFYGFITGSVFFLLCGWISVRGEKEARKLTRQEQRRLERKRRK